MSCFKNQSHREQRCFVQSEAVTVLAEGRFIVPSAAWITTPVGDQGCGLSRRHSSVQMCDLHFSQATPHAHSWNWPIMVKPSEPNVPPCTKDWKRPSELKPHHGFRCECHLESGSFRRDGFIGEAFASGWIVGTASFSLLFGSYHG